MKALIFKTFEELAIYWGIKPSSHKYSQPVGTTKCHMSKHELDREMRNNRHSCGWGK